MKTKTAKHQLSSTEKISLVREIRRGASISEISRSANISRTIIYAWLKKYDDLSSVPAQHRLVRKKRVTQHLKPKLTPQQIRRIKKMAISDPGSSIRLISKKAGVSVGAVWNTLAREELSSKDDRKKHITLNGKRLITRLSYQDRVEMFRRYESGEKIAHICRDFRISRTIFYRWMKKYHLSGRDSASLHDNMARDARHWRLIKGVKESVLPLIEEHPELTLRQLQAIFLKRNGVSISTSGLYYVLRRLGLTTYEDRLSYAKLVKSASRERATLIERKLPVLSIYSLKSTLSPPSFERYSIPLFATLLFIFTTFFTSVVFLTSPNGLSPTVTDTGQTQGNILSLEVKNEGPETDSPTYHSENYDVQKDFTSGVLAVNFEADSYSPDSDAKVTFGVLDPVGKTICDADITVRVVGPDNENAAISTENDTISTSSTCINGYNHEPDYISHINLNKTGDYHFQVLASTQNGLISQDKILQVRNNNPYIVSRTSFPDRIYPSYKYKSTIKVAVEKDFEGKVTDVLPAALGVSEISQGGVSTTSGGQQHIAWNVKWMKGKTYELSYTLSFPPKSPEIYKVGPLRIGNYAEQRAWQIAADALVSTDNQADAVGGRQLNETSESTTKTYIDSVRDALLSYLESLKKGGSTK